MVGPEYCVSKCPFCGGGLCGIRICDVSVSDHVNSDSCASSMKEMHSSALLEENRLENTSRSRSQRKRHGYVICDQCFAMWTDPDTTTCHDYLSAVEPSCPVCNAGFENGLSSGTLSSHWATWDEIKLLGWEHSISRSLGNTPNNQDDGFPFSFDGLS